MSAKKLSVFIGLTIVVISTFLFVSSVVKNNEGVNIAANENLNKLATNISTRISNSSNFFSNSLGKIYSTASKDSLVSNDNGVSASTVETSSVSASENYVSEENIGTTTDKHTTPINEQIASPANVARKIPTSGPIISLNFDDGYRSAYNIAVPILNKYNAKASFYIVTGYFKENPYITEKEVLKLQSWGHEIGAHTRHHVHLSEIKPSQLKDEILGSRQDLLKIGVKKVLTFAYPNGNYNDLVVQAVKDAGFVGARITKPKFNDKNVDVFLIKRQEVEAHTQFDEIKKAIDDTSNNKKWMVLVFHRIDDDGNPTSVRHEILEQIINYLNEKQIPIVTNEEGLKIIKNIN